MAHVVDAEDALTVAAMPTVLVRKSATVAGTLEYRLSVAVLVDTGSGREWTVYVDAIDGTVLEQAPMWICG